MRKFVPALMLVCGGVSGLALTGCFHEHKTVYREPAPTYVVVREMPQAPIVEDRGYPPGGGYVWIDGYWQWAGGRYVWERGRWVRPPDRNSAWVGPRYERHGNDYRYTPGRWQRPTDWDRDRNPGADRSKDHGKDRSRDQR